MDEGCLTINQWIGSRLGFMNRKEIKGYFMDLQWEFWSDKVRGISIYYFN